VDDSETASRRRRKLKVSHILIVLLLIAVCAFVVFRLSVRSKLRARIEAIRAAGYPVTLAELNEWCQQRSLRQMSANRQKSATRKPRCTGRSDSQ